MDADTTRDHAPHRQAAREALAEARRGPFSMKFFIPIVQQLPALLQRHGLGQTLAYLQLRAEGKPGSPYTMIARQLDRWLLTTLAASGRSALAVLSARDSRSYRE